MYASSCGQGQHTKRVSPLAVSLTQKACDFNSNLAPVIMPARLPGIGTAYLQDMLALEHFCAANVKQ